MAEKTAEKTAKAADCIRECCAYLKHLQDFYLAVLKAQSDQM